MRPNRAAGGGRHLPVVHHELLHGQEGVVAHLLVLVVHVVHHQLLPAELLDDPGGQKPRGEDAAVTFKCKLLAESPNSELPSGFTKRSYHTGK